MAEVLHPAQACDVLVIGSGLAGVAAATSAAEAGARTLLVSAGPAFSGASFSSSTWGFGMIGPEDAADAQDLVRTILDVGCGVADPALVQAFVSGILPAMDWLEGEGMELKRPERPSEREYIPCFDHKTRCWRGIGRKEFRLAFAKRLAELDVCCLGGLSLIELVPDDAGAIAGAIFFDRNKGTLAFISAASTILATGGLGGLFGQTLGAGEDTGTAHALALAAGAHLTNIEFIQIMPAILSPKGPAVFNEKTFRYLSLETNEGQALPQELLELRSSHGPLTARLGDAAVDLAIAEAGPAGCPARFSHLPDPLPELDETYFSWLRSHLGIDSSQSFRIALLAHASNGGIAIDAEGQTGAAGLFACGEATGGMHGADRLGGLSSAGCIVFGRAAGKAAARHAEGLPAERKGRTAQPFRMQASPLAAKVLPTIRLAADAECLAGRNETGLIKCASTLELLSQALRGTLAPSDDAAAVASTRRAEAELLAARQLVFAMRERTSSLGSHLRTDSAS